MYSNYLGKELFNYKRRFITITLLFAYSLIHVKLTGVFVDTSLEDWYAFKVRFPFGQRILIPVLVRLLGYVLPFDIDSLFFIAEFGLMTLFYFALKKLLSYDFSIRESQSLSWLFILLLPLVTVINYRFTDSNLSQFFYPYDSASLLFITIGYWLCLRKKWNYLVPWIFLATLNRESSLLLVCLIPLIHYKNLKEVIGPTLLCALMYYFARTMIFMMYSPGEGQVFELFVRGQTHFSDNLKWLLDEQNIFIFCFGFAGLPLFWFAFSDYIPPHYSLLRYLVFIYFFGLLLVGNFREPRIFLELIVLLYLPVCIAIKLWILGLKPGEQKGELLGQNANSNIDISTSHPPMPQAQTQISTLTVNPISTTPTPTSTPLLTTSVNILHNILYLLDRYFIIISIVFIVLFRDLINQLILYWFS